MATNIHQLLCIPVAALLLRTTPAITKAKPVIVNINDNDEVLIEISVIVMKVVRFLLLLLLMGDEVGMGTGEKEDGEDRRHHHRHTIEVDLMVQEDGNVVDTHHPLVIDTCEGGFLLLPLIVEEAPHLLVMDTNSITNTIAASIIQEVDRVVHGATVGIDCGEVQVDLEVQARVVEVCPLGPTVEVQVDRTRVPDLVRDLSRQDLVEAEVEMPLQVGALPAVVDVDEADAAPVEVEVGLEVTTPCPRPSHPHLPRRHRMKNLWKRISQGTVTRSFPRIKELSLFPN